LGSLVVEGRGRGEAEKRGQRRSGTQWEMSLEEEKREIEMDCLGFPVCDGYLFLPSPPTPIPQSFGYHPFPKYKTFPGFNFKIQSVLY
jgi:hypothetical protein